MLNRGISFGLFGGISIWIVVLAWVGLFVYMVKSIRAGKMRELWERVAIGLILAGGAGNISSRWVNGGVVDNLNFLGLFYNNGWDWMIGIGVGIYIIQLVGRKFLSQVHAT